MSEKCQSCGGCVFRTLEKQAYRQKKESDFKQTIGLIKNASPLIDAPVFIDDGLRRRADMAFLSQKGNLVIGFNEASSHNLVDIKDCPMLTPELNALLPKLRRFLEEFCSISLPVKNKKKKCEIITIKNGSVHLLKADNGIDIILTLPVGPELEHRLLTADFINANPEICRISWGKEGEIPEKIAETQPPELYIAGFAIEIPPKAFLQASKAAEQAMIKTVLSYMSPTTGKIADLFCGLGTFTYPLAQNKANEIISADSSKISLQGLKKALDRNQIHNVKIIERNLFKYPFDADDFKNIKAIVMDPPRAGAHEQCRAIAELSPDAKPEKIVFISCNPKTFVYDAQVLIEAGYVFERVTLIDQFVYSKHQELIALFTYNPKK
ncbi:MAG: class I SAM-dependent RNA methyltransferase [Alphaproteobacteria bacterium]|nr:class I SAM-dependent RNA methyltransferase [Alphaproteobacteria bacterium]